MLAGGGHAHLAVLRQFAMRAPRRGRVTLVSPARRSLYSGMVPGILTGAWETTEGAIDVAALAARAGIAFLQHAVTAIDPATSRIRLSDGQELGFDLLSLDIGSQIRGPEGGIGALEGGTHICVRPIETAAERLSEALAAIRGGERDGKVAIVGGGAAGVELAFGLRAALREVADVEIVLFEATESLLPDVPAPVARDVAEHLKAAGVGIRRGVGLLRATPGGVATADGEAHGFGTVVWASGAVPHELLADCGLPRDADGFLLVDSFLRCRGSATIFAAGDCAVLAGAPRLPRSGVYAVRQGPVLAANLRAMLEGERTRQRFRPQRDFLRLLSTGDDRAIAIRNGRLAHGRIWHLLKRRIDQRFVARFQPPSAGALRGPGAAMAAEMEECGGCAAKLAPEVLDAALFDGAGRAAPGQGPLVGHAEREDAAVFASGGDGRVVATLDAFPPFVDDLALAAEIGAVSAASDVYAMGGHPRQALLLAGLPEGPDAAMALASIRLGTERALRRMDIELVGGHTLRASEPLVGFTMLGTLDGEPLRKTGGQPGDVLVLGKELGTGIVLAAARGGECPAESWQAAIDSMLADNAATLALLRAAGVHALTDVTGFGLVGHLLEMLHPAGIHAELSPAQLPILPDAMALAAAGWESSATAGLRRSVPPEECARVEPALERLLFDPQTSGGLLAAVAAEQVEDLLASAESAGVPLVSIGRILDPAEADGGPTIRLT